MWTLFIFSLICSFLTFWTSVLCLTNESPLIKWRAKFQIFPFPDFLIGCSGFSKRHSIGRVIYTFVNTNLSNLEINKKRRSSIDLDINNSKVFCSGQINICNTCHINEVLKNPFVEGRFDFSSLAVKMFISSRIHSFIRCHSQIHHLHKKN